MDALFSAGFARVLRLGPWYAGDMRHAATEPVRVPEAA
jgi:hypothetical protein